MFKFALLAPWLIAVVCAAEFLLYDAFWISPLLVLLFAVHRNFRQRQGLIGPLSLPRNDAFLENQDIQWWYWTGHLQAENGRRFGFELVFFAFRNRGLFWDQLAHAAITDIDGDKLHFTGDIHFSKPNALENGFELSALFNLLRASGGGGNDRLHLEVDGFVLDLDLRETKPPILHYGGGAHPYEFGGYTYYYSRVGMASEGTLKIGDETLQVTGSSWFDRQHGDLLQAILVGWQWFAIELDDGRHLMIYGLEGSECAGSITAADGMTRALRAEEIFIRETGQWTSPNTCTVYPMGWEVEAGGIKLNIKPLVLDQELWAKQQTLSLLVLRLQLFWVGTQYWEGACEVSGDANGRAYVELNGKATPVSA